MSRGHTPCGTMSRCSAARAILAMLAMLAWSGPAANAQTSEDAQACWPGAPTLYTVATAHLDTQWRWTIQKTIDEYLPATLEENFALFEAYPHYVFNFEGAFRYQLIREYYPEHYERLKAYVAAGRWIPNGSWLDAVDTNMPSAESLIRHALYGQQFFRRELGVTSRDVYLPDCFGFSYALPSIAAHCGLVGFSTQKLTWGSAVGIPFDIGLWQGVDGSAVVAALNPGAYVSRIEHDLSADSAWVATIADQEARSGICAGYKYYGTGDTGGGPTEGSVQWLERSIEGEGPLHVLPAGADWMAVGLAERLARRRDGGPPDLSLGLRSISGLASASRLPHYRGELLMTDHGAGCYTSQSAMKRWNRCNERLADAAERAAVAAHWLGGLPYPRETLREAWTRFLWHQFHDDLTGTSIPEAYVFSWNDEILSLNQFASVLTRSVGAVTRALDTDVRGVPLVVYNPLSMDREDLVEAEVVFAQGPPPAVRVYSPEGEEVPSQVTARGEDRLTVVFLARAPSVGFAVYDVRPSERACALETGLTADAASLSNTRYLVEIGLTGDIERIYDRAFGRELLGGPAHLQLLDDSPWDWAAWEVDYEDIMAAPREVVGVPARTRVLEQGPARVVVEVARETDGSRFVQRISLGAGGAADRVEVDTEIDWRSAGTLLKAAFPLAVANEVATYDIGLGTIERPTNRPELYEVPAHTWADLTAAEGDYGVAILSDSRYGWDKPDAHTLRLTLLHTPEVNERWQWIADQRSQDLGRHRLRYQVQGHEGGWRAGGVAWQAERLNQPLHAFQVPRHDGELGRWISFLQVATEGHRAPVMVRALKLAEESDEILCRVQELEGLEDAAFTLRWAGEMVSAREVNGAEEPVASLLAALDPSLGAGGPARLEKGELRASVAPYQPRAFALQPGAPPSVLAPPDSRPVRLPYNRDGISTDADRTDGDFDGRGFTLAGDLLNETITFGGIEFHVGPWGPGQANVVACRGQEIELPADDFDRVYVLAASADGDREAAFAVDGHIGAHSIQDYACPVAQWNSRVAGGELIHDPARIEPAYIKRDPVAWVGTHRHGPEGENRAYEFTQLYVYSLPVPGGRGPHTLRLPEDPAVRVAAVSVARDENADVRAATQLYDRADNTIVRFGEELRDFIGETRFTLHAPVGPAAVHYTLDGAVPDRNSPRYTGPVAIDATTTVRARAFVPGHNDRFIAEATFTRREPRPAERPGDVTSGLVCRTYEGEWQRLPDFRTLTPLRTDTVGDVSLPAFVPREHFGLMLEGYLRVPREGVYTLHLWSDDGSALLLGDELRIDNDGLHGRQVAQANAALAAGWHPIEVHYFQGPGGSNLELWIEGPGLELQPVPAAMLAHRAD